MPCEHALNNLVVGGTNQQSYKLMTMTEYLTLTPSNCTLKRFGQKTGVIQQLKLWYVILLSYFICGQKKKKKKS
jgi:hypothetical protein